MSFKISRQRVSLISVIIIQLMTRVSQDDIRSMILKLNIVNTTCTAFKK